MAPPIKIRIRENEYDSIWKAALCEGVSRTTIRRHLRNGTLDRVGKYRRPYKFTVHGYEYNSYAECARRHNVGKNTVKRYVVAGRNDELPPRYKPGRSAYLDQLRAKKNAG